MLYHKIEHYQKLTIFTTNHLYYQKRVQNENEMENGVYRWKHIERKTTKYCNFSNLKQFPMIPNQNIVFPIPKYRIQFKDKNSLNIDIMRLSFYSVKLGKKTTCIIFEKEMAWRSKSFTQSIPQEPHKPIHFHVEKVKRNEVSWTNFIP